MKSSTETKPMNAAAAQGARLYLLAGLPRGFEVHPLAPETVVRIGRSSRCEVMIDHPSISRVHLELHIRRPMQLVDLGSANGTRLCREPVRPHRPRSLEVGDSITCGQATLLVQRLTGDALDEPWAELPGPASRDPASLHDQIAAVERQMIVQTLFHCGGNQTRAARLLGISRGTLRTRMDTYGIPRPKANADPD